MIIKHIEFTHISTKKQTNKNSNNDGGGGGNDDGQNVLSVIYIILKRKTKILQEIMPPGFHQCTGYPTCSFRNSSLVSNYMRLHEVIEKRGIDGAMACVRRRETLLLPLW